MGADQRPTNLTPGVYRFDHFFRERMYGPGGYWENGNGVGIDYHTHVSSETYLARRLGRWLDEKWREQGFPAEFNVYEIAAGDGTLCRDLLSMGLDCAHAIKYTAVEINPLYQGCFPEDVIVRRLMPEDPQPGVIFANELLDAQPVRFVSSRAGEWQELYIHVGDKASYEWKAMNEDLPSTLRAIQGMYGSAPWISEAAELMHDLTRRFTGDVLMIDYAYPRTTDLPGKNWLACNHRFRHVGALELRLLPDMSTEVPIDQLEELFYPAVVMKETDWAGIPDDGDHFYAMEWRFDNGRNVPL